MNQDVELVQTKHGQARELLRHHAAGIRYFLEELHEDRDPADEKPLVPPPDAAGRKGNQVPNQVPSTDAERPRSERSETCSVDKRVSAGGG
ncbi:hypothetical protein HPP92_004011 [Vanilla planifolia]|uniref:Uncharacterized protein n=1 Tax=Vanilla planifolia TaxID=51239 RepID=A0A835S2W2_VANPL|nr:hypothetical protein HPP92_004011 [Vanilla planifolia]